MSFRVVISQKNAPKSVRFFVHYMQVDSILHCRTLNIYLNKILLSLTLDIYSIKLCFSRSCAVIGKSIRLTRMVQDGLFFAPKVYIGTPRGRKKVKRKATARQLDAELPYS